MLWLRSLRYSKCSVRYLSSSGTLQQNVSMNIFDRKAKLLQKNRGLCSGEVELCDYLREEVGYRLADRIFDIKKTFPLAVELGCHRGQLSKHIDKEWVDHLVMCDLSQEALDQAATPGDQVKVTKRVVDEERLPFEPDSVDLFISCLALHWVNDLPSTFQQVMKCLKKDGVFLGVMFGCDTLFELRSALQLAETERLGGMSVHVSPFTQVADIGGLLHQAGFSLLTIDTDELVVQYPSMFHLMEDLKGMGENNCAWNRPTRLDRQVLLGAGAIYESLYGSNGKVPATFQTLYFVGWKPDSSQPKPARRGSQTHSIQELDSMLNPPKAPKPKKPNS